MESGGNARELSNSMSGALLATVRRESGEAAVQRLLQYAEETRSPAEIEDSAQWSSYVATRRLFHAAVAVTGDPELPRRAGAEIFHRYASSEVVAMLRGLGSPAAVMPLVADLGGKQTTISTLECLECTDRSAVIASRIRKGVDPDAAFCEYRAGLFGSIPTIFGLRPADVDETECQLRGDPRCLYGVSWDPTPEREPAQEISFLREQVAALTSRFEALEVIASELATVGEIDDVLHTITARASVAVRAPRYLLAVRLPSDDLPRVHCIGVTEAEVTVLANEILADPVDDHDGTWLVVDIAGATTRFGRLAALNSEGHRFVPEERRLLMAYAGHAAAALQTAAAWEEARRQVQTLGNLLDLSTALTVIRSREEAAGRLASTLPKVLGCEEASVWLWHTDEKLLSCRGHSSGAPIDASGHGSSPDRSVRLSRRAVARLTGTIRPLSFGTDDGPELRRIGALSGFAAGLVMPIVAHHELFGVAVIATAGLDTQERDTIARRLPGVAGLAAGAFAAAQLFEQIRHQAHHDPLTGLPNLRALEEAALVPASRPGSDEAGTTGLIFVDLDRFKRVNDDFGHAVGDQLLIAVGQRLRQVVRSGDRVIRIGGDEFAIHLGHVRGPSEAEVVAARLLQTVATPFDLAGHRLEISASIGIALESSENESIDRLLSRSDAAMYRAKAAGGATSRFAEPT